jgi:hypothetical protein
MVGVQLDDFITLLTTVIATYGYGNVFLNEQAGFLLSNNDYKDVRTSFLKG